MGLYPETEHNPTPRVLYISPEIREWPQWVIWRWGEMREDGSYQKIPISPLTGVAENYNDPATWGSLGKAQMVIRKYGCDGIGFVLTWEDPYTVIDLDDCRNPETGEVLQRGMRQVRRFDSLTLVSPSGRGLQIWVKGKLPVGRFNKKAEYGIEGYSAGQFMTYSGEVFHDAPIRDSQSALTALYGSLYPAEGVAPQKASVISHRPVSKAQKGSLDEVEIQRRLKEARRHTKTGHTFRKLEETYSKGEYESKSDADQVFLNRLAFWMACDGAAMRKVFLASARAKGKYRRRYRKGGPESADSYLDRNIKDAIETCTATYSKNWRYTDEVKEEARQIVGGLREVLARSTIEGKKRAVMEELFEVGTTKGRVRDDGDLEFNANQEAIAARVGTSQPTVSRIIRELLDEGWLYREVKGWKSKGKKGKNSVYVLSPVIADRNGELEGVNTTYSHRGVRLDRSAVPAIPIAKHMPKQSYVHPAVRVEEFANPPPASRGSPLPRVTIHQRKQRMIGDHREQHSQASTS